MGNKSVMETTPVLENLFERIRARHGGRSGPGYTLDCEIIDTIRRLQRAIPEPPEPLPVEKASKALVSRIDHVLARPDIFEIGDVIGLFQECQTTLQRVIDEKNALVGGEVTDDT
jgi:hypothetical protein